MTKSTKLLQAMAIGLFFLTVFQGVLVEEAMVGRNKALLAYNLLKISQATSLILSVALFSSSFFAPAQWNGDKASTLVVLFAFLGMYMNLDQDALLAALQNNTPESVVSRMSLPVYSGIFQAICVGVVGMLPKEYFSRAFNHAQLWAHRALPGVVPAPALTAEAA